MLANLTCILPSNINYVNMLDFMRHTFVINRNQHETKVKNGLKWQLKNIDMGYFLYFTEIQTLLRK